VLLNGSKPHGVCMLDLTLLTISSSSLDVLIMSVPVALDIISLLLMFQNTYSEGFLAIFRFNGWEIHISLMSLLSWA